MERESVATHSVVPFPRALLRVDGAALATWALAGGLVLYLGLDGGGYGVVVSSQVGLVLWWIVLVGAAWKVLPAGRLTRVAWAGLALFGSFVAWTALASTWSLSSGRSLQDLSLVATYLGVLLLAVAIHRDRERALRHTVNAIGAAIVIVAALAVVSRVVPSVFPAARVTGAVLVSVRGRLSWPLNYWNGLAALVALGLPLVLSIATSARKLRVQAVAAASLPLLALCAYLTFSRGGAIASVVAVLTFLVFVPDRFPKLATTLVSAAGSAVMIAGAAHRSALEHGLTDHAASSEGRQLLVAIVLVCGAVGLAQVGIGLAARHGTLPRALTIPRRRARALLAGGVVVALVAALAAGAPSRLSRSWTDFQHPPAAVLNSTQPARFVNLSGSGRYAVWKVAVKSTSGHLLTGSGPGTFQLVWLPRATVQIYIVNAHSLYIETLAEVGLVGLALLVGFFLLVLGAAVRVVMRSEYEARVAAAGAVAALLAFVVSAAADWVWQLPVLPAAFLLLAAAVLAPAPRRAFVRASATAASPEVSGADVRRRRLVLRCGLMAMALACLVAIGIPLATSSDVSKSQAAARARNVSSALADARSAARLEPGAASPQLQLALVLEIVHDYPAALAAARRATRDESQNWSNWLVLSRIEAESGLVRASVTAYRRARSLNPRSTLFAQ